MEQIGISKFRENLLGYIKRARRGECLVITSRGRVMARLVPPDEPLRSAREILEKLRQDAHVGDLVAAGGDRRMNSDNTKTARIDLDNDCN